MKSRAFYICFIAVCLAVCLVPLAGMTFARSDRSIGNERAVPWPSLVGTDGQFNQNYLKEAGAYFERHFAFRPALITADALVQQKVFLTSNTDSVITGDNSWLYYASTLPDFLGKDPLSDRELYNLAHNLRLTANYVESRGAELLFMIPPNKNALYGEHMPYYASLKYRADESGNRFHAVFEREGVPYLDLFALFHSQDEVLYFREDSHWNNKGALMVYHETLNRLGKAHESYENAGVTRAKDHSGDLRAMLFPGSRSAEWDYRYDVARNYAYIPTAGNRSDPVSVEDYHIEAANDSARGRLLMYRDSFGNSLIPFFANEYGYSVFSKTVPYKLAADLETYRPDHVILERVQRSVRDFIVSPPIIPAQETGAEDLPPRETVTEYNCADGDVTVQCELCEADRSYVLFSGFLPRELPDLNSQIYLKIGWPDGRAATFHTFYLSNGETDRGFAAYLPVAEFGTLSDARNAKLSVCVTG